MIGSMSPDFSYFTAGAVRSATHSLQGLFTFCWPVGLALWLVFVRVLERPTLALMPPAWAARIVPPHREWSLRTLVAASVAVILGAVTHILWDSFTHGGTHVTTAIPALQVVAFEIHHYGSFAWFWVLQQLSTIFGLVVLFIWAVKRLRSPPAQPPPHPDLPAIGNRVRVVALAIVVAVSLGFAILRYSTHPTFALEYRLFHLAIGGMTGFALSWLAVAVAVTLFARRPLAAPGPRE